jgi:hypothetical protein
VTVSYLVVFRPRLEFLTRTVADPSFRASFLKRSLYYKGTVPAHPLVVSTAEALGECFLDASFCVAVHSYHSPSESLIDATADFLPGPS